MENTRLSAAAQRAENQEIIDQLFDADVSIQKKASDRLSEWLRTYHDDLQLLQSVRDAAVAWAAAPEAPARLSIAIAASATGRCCPPSKTDDMDMMILPCSIKDTGRGYRSQIFSI